MIRLVSFLRLHLVRLVAAALSAYGSEERSAAGYRQAKETKRGGMDARSAEPPIVCAEQRVSQEG